MITDIRFGDINITLDIDNLRVSIKQMNYGVFSESYTKHCHGKNYYELHLVCGGKGKLILDNAEHSLEKGTLYMTGPNISHEQLTDETNPMCEYCMGFELKQKKNSKNTAVSKVLLETAFWLGNDNGECERLFMMLAGESNTRLIGYLNNIQNIISSILIQLARHYTGSKKGCELTSVTPDDRRMNIVDSCFIYNYATITEEGLGKMLGLSSRQVQRFLKKNYGKTFSEMKREARLNKASELIKRGISIEDASVMVGYNSPAFFRKLLKSRPSIQSVL